MNLSEIIDFEINNVLVEFRTKFNLEKFKSIKGVEDKINYAKKHLQLLGEGSSRIVFLLSNRFVLKIAISEKGNNEFIKGVAQNKAEVEIYNKTKSDLIAKIYDFHTNYSWIISELVRPVINEKEFEKLSNINEKDFSTIIYDINLHSITEDIADQLIIMYTDLYEFEDNKKEKERYNRYIKILNNNDFIKNVISFIEETKLDPTELSVIEHWGKTVDGKVVLLDYGATEEVIKKYY